MLKDFIVYTFYEQIGLEILKSATLSKNAIQTLEIAQNIFLKKQKKTLVEKIENVKILVEQGENIIDSLYSQGFLSFKTFQELSRINDITKLEVEHIEEYINYKNREKQFKSDTNKALFSNYIMLMTVIPVAIYNIYQFKPFIIKYMTDSMFYDLFYNIAYHPLTFGVLFVGGFVIGLIVIIQFLISLIVNKKLEDYSFISLVRILREAKINYIKIFTFLLSYKFSRKIKKVIQEVYDNLEIETAEKALLPIVKNEPVDTALIFLSKIYQKDDNFAWRFLQNKVLKRTELTIETLKPTFNLLLMIAMLIIILLSVTPMIIGTESLLSNI